MVFCSYHNVSVFIDKFKEAKFELKNIIIWYKKKKGMGDLYGNFSPRYEMILFLTKGRPLLKDTRYSNVILFDNGGNKNHPTEKPVGLIQILIKSFTDENKIVLDPFMGSGTTAKACYELNRRFIGFELDPEYCEIARKRLKQKVITGFFGTQANSTSSSFNKDLTGNSDEFPQILPLAELR